MADRRTTRNLAAFQKLLQPSPGPRSAELDARSGRAGLVLCGATFGGPVVSSGYVPCASLDPVRGAPLTKVHRHLRLCGGLCTHDFTRPSRCEKQNTIDERAAPSPTLLDDLTL